MLGLWLDSIILKVFLRPNDSVKGAAFPTFATCTDDADVCCTSYNQNAIACPMYPVQWSFEIICRISCCSVSEPGLASGFLPMGYTNMGWRGCVTFWRPVFLLQEDTTDGISSSGPHVMGKWSQQASCSMELRGPSNPCSEAGENGSHHKNGRKISICSAL